MSMGKPPGPCVAIMAGGRGLRLWPRSRAHVPKQLQGFFGGPVLLRQSLTAAATLAPASRTYVITAADLAAQTRALAGPAVRVLTEPVGRETAACAGLAALHAERDHPGAVLVLLPSDHWIGDEAAFSRTLHTAVDLAEGSDCLVTVGVTPTRPETGYGYIQVAPDGPDHFVGVRFREKPNAAEAARLIAGGDVLWNAGIFVVRAAVLLDLIDRHLPAVKAGLDQIRAALGTPEEDAVVKSVYTALPSISLDRGIAEKLGRILVVPASFPWDDLGSWTAFARVLPRDDHGNLIAGDVHVHDATGCLVDTPDLKTALLGVKDLVIVQDGDRLLIAAADRAQDVKQVAAAHEASRSHKGSPRQLLYFGRFFETSGYAAEARSYALGLKRMGYRIRLLPLPERAPVRQLIGAGALAKLEAMAQVKVDPRQAVALLHQKPDTFPETDCPVQIARTTFETDRIPHSWVERLNRVTEVWVPSAFNLETFAASGVHPGKLRHVRQGIDTAAFHPGAPPLALPPWQGFTFLSTFTWQDRKGWDLLVQAFLAEFKPDEGARLVLWAQPYYRTPAEMQTDLNRLMESVVGNDPSRAAPVLLLTDPCPDDAMPGLYTACDAFVLPTRGEGWGRPFAEAMACGRPVIGTAWGGNLDFMTPANSYLIETEGLTAVADSVGVAQFRGHRWAQPSVEHLRTLMRRVAQHPAEAAQKGARARADMVAGWDVRQAVAELAANLERFYDSQGGPILPAGECRTWRAPE